MTRSEDEEYQLPDSDDAECYAFLDDTSEGPDDWSMISSSDDWEEVYHVTSDEDATDSEDSESSSVGDFDDSPKPKPTPRSWICQAAICPYSRCLR